MDYLNWVLLVWVITGDNHHMEEIQFGTEQQCEIARVWTETEGAKNWTKRYVPKAKCFRRK